MQFVTKESITTIFLEELTRIVKDSIPYLRGLYIDTAPSSEYLRAGDLALSNFLRSQQVKFGRYAILSHRWVRGEVHFEDFSRLSTFGLTKNDVHNTLRKAKATQKLYFGTHPYIDTLLQSRDEVHSAEPTATSSPSQSLVSTLQKMVNVETRIAGPNINTGFYKLINFCFLAYHTHSCEFAWMDTCCINKSSSAEIDESIRLMFNWYRDSTICIVHLGETLGVKVEDIAKDPWMRRGWTLQELLAPTTIKFYNKRFRPLSGTTQTNDKVRITIPSLEDGRKEGESLCEDTGFDEFTGDIQKGPYPAAENDLTVRSTASGDSDAVISKIAEATGISLDDLLHFKPGLSDLRKRLSWASRRETTRVEDMAYCLLGIFNINMTIAYGEGEGAFYRFQAAIMELSNDRNLFIWNGRPSHRLSILASSPACFSAKHENMDVDNRAAFSESSRPPPQAHYTLTNNGLLISVSLYNTKTTLRVLKTLAQRFDGWEGWERTSDRYSPDQYRLAVLGYVSQAKDTHTIYCDSDEDDISETTGRANVDGTAETGVKGPKPVYLLLVLNKRQGHVYYKRSSRNFDSSRIFINARPADPELIYIR